MGRTALLLLAIGGPAHADASVGGAKPPAPKYRRVKDRILLEKPLGALVLYDGPAAYNPSVDEIAELERRLPAFIQSTKHCSAAAILKQLPGYVRWYIGAIRGSRHTILVSFACSEYLDDGARRPGFDWTVGPPAVYDGGACFFDVEYDPASHAFANFHVHGEA